MLQFAQFALLTQSCAVFAVFCLRFTNDHHLRTITFGHLVSNNKSEESNLGRGPRRGSVAHVRRKVPIGYNGATQICHKSTPSRGPIPKPHYLPHPWTSPTYDAKRHPDPIRRFSTMHWTDRRTHVYARTYVRYGPTDRPQASLTTIGHCATRATRPNNTKMASVQYSGLQADWRLKFGLKVDVWHSSNKPR